LYIIKRNADDTKFYDTLFKDSDIDLRWLCDWSLDWQMLFNVDKCKLVYFGYKNKRNAYS